MGKNPDRTIGKYLLSCILLSFAGMFTYGQQVATDTIAIPVAEISLIHKDPRIDRLGEEMAAYNTSLAQKIKIGNGFRLMLISSTDRAQVMKIRTTILQIYPDQKLYLTFIAPYLKLKMGNFLSRKEAEDMKKELMSLHIVSGSVYIVPEQVEIKPDQTIPLH